MSPRTRSDPSARPLLRVVPSTPGLTATAWEYPAGQYRNVYVQARVNGEYIGTLIVRVPR